MELIKIEAPCTELMESSLTEEQCDQLFEQVCSVINSEESFNKALRESELGVQLATLGGVAVIALISALTKWIKNKYSLAVSKLIDQSKELNDLYTKVDDILKHDKMARFKHRNDKLDTDLKKVVMRDVKDPRKVYQVAVDFIGYDPEFFINEINDIMRYVDNESKNKSTDIKNMKESLMEKIDSDFKQNHGWIESCEPAIKTESFKGVPLEKCLMSYKVSIEACYSNVSVLNNYVKAELQYMQLMQQAYNKMTGIYASKGKEAKDMVDEIFKKLLKNISMSMDFDSKIMGLYEEEMKFYVGELQKIYDFLRK